MVRDQCACHILVKLAMILSFHPCIQADVNVIVAGRAPGSRERSLVRRAAAIILPQGLRQELYTLCRHHCQRVFPNYDLRFQYPGKIGNILLFRRAGMPHAKTRIFYCVEQYRQEFPLGEERLPFPLPFILKGNSGGEGELVFKIDSTDQLAAIIARLEAMEASGLQGFIVQEWVNHGGRDLRVVILYDRLLCYWRVQKDPAQFLTNLRAGSIIDRSSDPHLQQKAIEAVRRFCEQTGINLAGIDLMFAKDDARGQPLFGEINYWFGRRSFGSSEAYYAELKKAVRRWLARFNPAWPARIR